MRKVLVILFSVSISIIGCNKSSPAVNGDGRDALPENAQKKPYKDNADMIKVTLTYPDGNISAEGDLLDGKKVGSWTEFHPNGMVKSITGYVNGLKEGNHVEIDNTGRLLKKSYYHHDQLHGINNEYKLARVKEERIYENGKLNGIVKIYYDNGKLMEESPYLNGKRHGVAKWFDQEGNVSFEYEYKDGELVKK